MLAAWQQKMIFVGMATQGKPEAIVRPRDGQELIELKLPDGSPFNVMFAPSTTRDPTLAPTVIFFYGNGQYLASCFEDVDGWRKLGTNICIVEYPGYGISGGKPTEQNCYDAATAAWDYLQQRPGIDGTKIIAVGWSLGGGSAVDLAARKPVAALITVSTFTSMPDMASKLYPWLPLRYIVAHRFENEAKMPRVTAPVLIVHSKDDGYIPWTMAQRLVKACKAPVTTLWLEGYDHNEGWEARNQIDPTVKKVFDEVAAV